MLCVREMFYFKGLFVCLISDDYKVNIVIVFFVFVIDIVLLW